MAIAPRFLTTEDVIDIHRDQIDLYGGTHGIRDLGLLDSAVHVPQGTMGGEYLLPDLFEMAGAMMYSLIQNHALIDGNKRVGVAAALVFLSINGVEIRQDDDALYRLAIEVAAGVARRGEAAEYFKRRVEPAGPPTRRYRMLATRLKEQCLASGSTYTLQGNPFLRITAVNDQFEVEPATWDEFPDVPECRDAQGNIPKRVNTIVHITPAPDAGWLFVDVAELVLFNPETHPGK